MKRERESERASVNKQNETELKMEYLMQECVRARARDSTKYNKLIKCIAMPTVLDLDGIYWIVIVYAGWLAWVSRSRVYR